MVFASISFLYYFLPIVFIIYYLVPQAAQNIVLLLASLVFYSYSEPVYILLMLLAILSGFLHGLVIDKFKSQKEEKYSRMAMISSVVVSISLLGFFKYADFFIANFNHVFKANISFLRLVQPIGISFYTFQILSYTIEVYRGSADVQRNFLHFALYVSLFPQLIAGPIVRYTTVASALDSRRHSWEDFAIGVRRFTIGLAKKVLLANVLGELCSAFKAVSEKTVLFYWLYAVAFTLQIYFDFSGYSDMAIGLGKFFGFHFLENFNYPYIAQSITEFWRRWHISLGTWFRDYLYIPLGGNRVSTARWLFNILLVWLVTGFWHGADWNFIIWGLFFGLLLILEKYFYHYLFAKLPPFFSHLYVLFCVIIGFVIFDAGGIYDGVSSVMGMLGLLEMPLFNQEALYYLQSYAVVLLLAIIGSTPLFNVLVRKVKSKKHGELIVNLVEPVFLLVLLLMVTAYLVDGSFNPFLYFRF
ncbi:MAG: MBOAT family protein [Firmicutes bacterium]|nr:MBOAT family protein [Bacillota bacterium]